MIKISLLIVSLISFSFGEKDLSTDLAYQLVLEKINKKIVPISFIDNVFKSSKIELHAKIPERFARPYEKKSWEQYKKLFIKESRIVAGVKFYSENKDLILKVSKNADLVITNRFLKKKSIDTWPLFRIMITNIRHLLIKSLLGVPYDASGAYRCYDPNKIKLRDIIKAEDNSYSFFWESLFIFHQKKYLIKEISVTLHKRYLGSSKMTLLDILKALLYLLKIFIKK